MLSAIYGLFVTHIYKIITRVASGILSANDGIFWCPNNWITPRVCGNIARGIHGIVSRTLKSNPLNYATKTRHKFYRILVFNHFYINDLNTQNITEIFVGNVAGFSFYNHMRTK